MNFLKNLFLIILLIFAINNAFANLDAEDEIEFNKSKQPIPIINNEKLTMFPNPNNGSFNLETNLQEIKRLELWSMDGKFIRVVNYVNYEEINLKDIEKGVYILKAISSKGSTFINKLVIQ